MRIFSMLLVLVTILTVLLSIGSTDLAHAKRKYTLVYYDGHLHSTYSDGSGTVEEIKATAQSRGHDVVIVTDHCEYLTRDTWDDLVADTVEATDENILVLPGFRLPGVKACSIATTSSL